MPGSFPVAPKDVDTRYSLVGAMWAQLPGSSCPPPNQQAWAKALASGPITITSAPSPYHYKPLEVSPDLQLAVMGLPLNMSSLSLNVTLTSKPGSAAAALPLTVAATIADGYVFSDTVMTGGPQLQQMAPERSSTTATASLAVTTSPTDKACQAKLSKSNAICTTGLLWNERSREKSYACTLSDPGIARLIGPVLPINCKTAAAAAAGAKPGSSSAMAVDDASLMASQSSCAIAMRLVGMPQGTFAECVATGCHFSAGRPSFVCDGVACSCPKGCPASYLKTFTDVSGAVTLTCDATGQDCSIVLGSLNMKIAASCEAAECIDPKGPKLVSTAELARSGPPIAPPLVAALPLLLLALGGLACGAALARYKPYLRGSSSSSSKLDGKDMAGLAAAGNLSNGGGSTAAPSVLTARTGPGTGRIAMLAFADVTADVKVPRTWRDIACVKSYKSWGDQGASAPAGLKADQAESKPYDLERGSNGSSKGEEDSPTPMSGSSSGGGGGHNGTLIVPISTGPTAAAAAAGSSSSSGRWRPVLRGVSGSVASGQVLGVMGPSGGGKSTLLLKLCGSLGAGGRGSSWRSGGLVALDGVAAPAPLLAALTALVPQDDSLMRSLTAEECIRYSAALRLDPSLPPAAVAARVDDVMSRLGLSHVARSTVLSGTGVAGVSGGERRRVAIGMELVIDPQILVLDEPLGQARQALGIPNQKRPLGRQLGVLFWRGGLDMLRNPLLTAAHAAGGLLLGLLVGVIFFAVKNDTSGAQNRVGAIFFALCLLAFTSVTSVDLIQTESAAAGREMQRRYYHPAAYAATKLVLDGLLLRALPALLFALPFYFLMGLNPAALQFCTFLLVLIGFSAAVGALALGLAAGLNTPGKTLLAMNLVLLLGVLFGGFLANKGSIPVWLRWVSWLSVFRYSWEALVINELQGLDLFLSAPGVSLSLPVKGEVFLQIIGVQTGLFVVDIAVLAAIYAACCVFVLAVVGWRNRQRQH
ncbi:hypothetical protein OEZ85_000376 [Tetradesmus obliquus]|uniref:ABC transporter domain-containing protein n=1 Tax=Tetradesmus obliquus TaxID=3088 RepID=A0ABY8USQ0_TETOB|nr:hypothetical protein OEZ85_000376 [Tetradesmus obliquus]WIA23678.1 hypothetical protein OEZ85_000376 [Tetradesmus obliquus]